MYSLKRVAESAALLDADGGAEDARYRHQHLCIIGLRRSQPAADDANLLQLLPHGRRACLTSMKQADSCPR